MNLALAYFKKGDCEDARTEFATVHAARPQDLSSAMLLGYCDTKVGKANEAVALLGPMEPGHEGNTDFEFALASALMESGNIAEGLPRMERVAKATNTIDAWVMAGSARLHREEFHEARTDLDAAVKVNPSFPGLNSLAGQARDALGDTDAAMSAFEAALRQDPRDFNANLYLGTMRLKQRDFDSARPLLELAQQLQPNMPQVKLQMSRLNAMTGKYDEAAAALESLERADPNWLDPHVELASIYYKLHRPEDGQRERAIVEQIEAQQRKAGPSNK
jgi:tetratricopeptide (TPR) repeat protein